MAWPCITRVCCLARFWNQLDKSDLAVPLTIHNYSDIEEPAEDGAGAGGAPQQLRRIPTGGRPPARPQQPQQPLPRPRAASALPVSASAPSLRDGLAGVQRASRKGRGGGGRGRGRGRRQEPFAAETQYQQDFRAWPVQKRDALPWIGECRRGDPPAAASHVYVLPTAEQQGGRRRYSAFEQMWPSSASPPGIPKSTSFRQECHPSTGAKRSRASKTKQGFIIPEDHFVRETSYKADCKIPEVKAKFSPNPSAVFQAPSRILNV